MINQLKWKFQSLEKSDKCERYRVLTTLPKSWSLRKIIREFGVSMYEAQTTKILIETKGFMTHPDPIVHPKARIDPTMAKSVEEIFLNDDISKMCPGRQDFKIVRLENNKKVQIQKRLALMTLKEAYEEFKLRFVKHNIGFSKFATLRPPQVVIPGASGTHAICVCMQHQNVKLMTDVLNSFGIEVTYKQFMQLMICSPAEENCYQHKCAKCPGMTNIHQFLVPVLEKLNVDHLEFAQWCSTDRYQLEKISKASEDFISIYENELKKLIPHSFLSKSQSKFLKNTKSSLKEGEVAVITDFAENHTFHLQEETQSFNFNRPQATLQVAVVYYKEHNELKNLNFVGISDVLKHDYKAVHVFIGKLITFLKKRIATLSHIKYFSDGAGSQYKNKFGFINLCHHMDDFGVSAEWHFFATSHGKGPCDGIGGVVKRKAYQANLKRDAMNQIKTAKELFDFCESEFEEVNFVFL